MKKQQKLKYRFNIVDVLLLFVILAVAFVVYYFVAGRNSAQSGKENTIRYTVELKTVDKDYLENINLGDMVIEVVRNRTVGKVVDIEYGPSWSLTTNTETGEMSKAYYPPINIPLEDTEQETLPDENGEEAEQISEDVENTPENIEPIYDYYNVRVTIEADADYTGSSYSIGGFDVVVGEMIYFRVPHYVGSGYCVELEVVE